MKAVAEKITETRVALTIEVDAEQVDEALERAYRKVVRQVTVPGFRKGRVPRRIIEARFGKEILYEDALDELIPKAYFEAVTEHELDPIDQPAFSDVQIEAGKPLRFRAEVDVMPEAKLGEYKGLKVEKEIERVEESDIDHMLEHLREEHAELVSVERTTVQEGDFVQIDFEGFVDGEPFQGGAAKGYTVQIGSGQLVDGFEEQLVGAEIDSEVEVRVTFPGDHPSEELRGKEALFKVTVRTIKERRLPELNDEFAADVSDAKSLAELREQIRRDMEEAARRRADEQTRRKLVEMVRDGSEVAEIPEVLVERELNRRIEDLVRIISLLGLSLEEYLQRTEQSLDDLRKDLRPGAERQVKENIVLHTIVKREGITVEPEELDAFIERLAAESSNPESARRRWQDPDRRQSLESALALEKAVDHLVANAVIEEKEVPSRGHGHAHHHDDEPGEGEHEQAESEAETATKEP